MIIKRLAEGIRNQDWFVVGVEILIVVVGIFIGLQVDDWNGERQERALLQSYLERLRIETESNLTIYNETSDEIIEQARILAEYHDYLRGEGSFPDNLTLLTANLCRNGVIGVPPYNNSVLEELVSTGYLGLFPDQELIASLREYMGRQFFSNDSVRASAPAALRAFENFRPYRDLRPLFDVNMGACIFDFVGFEQNEKAASEVADAQRLHSFLVWTFRPVIEALEQVHERLELYKIDGADR